MKKAALVALALLVAIQLTTSYAGHQTQPKPDCYKGNTVCTAQKCYGCTQWLCTSDMHV